MTRPVLIRAHAVPDGVYSVLPDRKGRLTTLDEFLHRTVIARPAPTIRVLACVPNLDLIVGLGAVVPALRVQLVNPSVVGVGVDGRDEEDLVVDPVCALTALGDEPGLAPSCGGPHRLDPKTLASYRLAAALRDPDVSAWRQALRAHPAWPALSFVRPEPRACAEVLAAALDPRWFVRQPDPDRSRPFLRFFGADRSRPRRTARYRAAEAAWLDGGGPIEAPEGCFLTACADQGDGRTARVVTTARFLGFLRGAWLEVLHTRRRPVLARRVPEAAAFEPDLFFEALLPGRGGPYAAAFRAHIEAFSGDE